MLRDSRRPRAKQRYVEWSRGHPIQLEAGTRGSVARDSHGLSSGAALAHRGHGVSGSLTEAELTLIDMDDGTHQVSLTVHDGFESSTADSADIIINNLEPIVIVPVDQSRALFAAAPGPKQLLVIPSADHNDPVLVAGREMIETVVAFIAEAATS